MREDEEIDEEESGVDKKVQAQELLEKIDDQELLSKLVLLIQLKKKPRLSYLHLLFNKVKSADVLKKTFLLYIEYQKLLIETDETTAYHMMEAGLRIKNPNIVMQHFRQIMRFRLFPDIYVFHRAITYCIKKKNYRNAYYAYETMLIRGDVTPTEHTYNLMVYSCASEGKLDKAIKVAERAKAQFGTPSFSPYHWQLILDGFWANDQQADKILEYAKIMESEGAEHNKWTKSFVYRARMLKEIEDLSALAKDMAADVNAESPEEKGEILKIFSSGIFAMKKDI